MGQSGLDWSTSDLHEVIQDLVGSKDWPEDLNESRKVLASSYKNTAKDIELSIVT
tara:strand:+ start:336 stop:500 length:165 start_codon:yes stop_codon:yes gene_type:complete